MPALLNNAAATGPEVLIPKGEYCFSCSGTWAGATATLQRRTVDVSAAWLAVGVEATLTANGQCLCELPGGLYRVLIAGGPPSAMYANLEPTE